LNEEKPMSNLRKQLPMFLAALTLIVLLAPSVEAGDRVVFRVNESFEVNGQIYPSGRVVLRAITSYTPVTTLNEIRVGRDSLGVLVAHQDSSEPAATSDELIFRRAAEGHLVLEALAVRGEPIRRFAPNAPGGTNATNFASNLR